MNEHRTALMAQARSIRLYAQRLEAIGAADIESDLTLKEDKDVRTYLRWIENVMNALNARFPQP